ncbi:hypothetical protein AB5V95_00700 [Metamycoplasma spumans]|uniref:hypothetical protein n=1 Tax=Metamycoplasma spumans TaxID=92406 RepID=UPI0034DDAC3B
MKIKVKLLYSLSSLFLSTLPVIALSCEKNDNNINKTENSLTTLNQDAEYVNYFNSKFANKAIEIKKIYRLFNADYYFFYKEYNNLSTWLFELTKEQSIEALKNNLELYFNENFSIESKTIKDFSLKLAKLNWILKELYSSLSNLNFVLENYEIKTTNLDEFKKEVDKNYNKYIYDKNFEFNFFKSYNIPILNLNTELDALIKSINQDIKNNKLDEFLASYNKAKENIYDNANHINLDINFLVIYKTLTDYKDKDYHMSSLLE